MNIYTFKLIIKINIVYGLYFNYSIKYFWLFYVKKSDEKNSLGSVRGTINE